MTDTQKNLLKSTIQSFNDVKVTFIKKNGDERVMECTTNLNFIPESLQPKEGSEKVNFSNEVARVFDKEKQAWRSFRFDSIIKVEIGVFNG